MRTGWLVRRALGVAGRGLVAHGRPEPDVLRGRVRTDPDWRRVEDGHAARLGPGRTIEVTRKGHWASRDPLDVEPGWAAPWKALGLAAWAGAVAVAWWQGSSHGRGPLARLQEPWEPWGPRG